MDSLWLFAHWLCFNSQHWPEVVVHIFEKGTRASYWSASWGKLPIQEDWCGFYPGHWSVDQLLTLTGIQDDHGGLARSALVQPQWALCLYSEQEVQHVLTGCWASCHRIWSSQTEPEAEFQVWRVSLWRHLDCISALCIWRGSVSFIDASMNLNLWTPCGWFWSMIYSEETLNRIRPHDGDDPIRPGERRR